MSYELDLTINFRIEIRSINRMWNVMLKIEEDWSSIVRISNFIAIYSRQAIENRSKSDPCITFVIYRWIAVRNQFMSNTLERNTQQKIGWTIHFVATHSELIWWLEISIYFYMQAFLYVACKSMKHLIQKVVGICCLATSLLSNSIYCWIKIFTNGE